MPRSRETLLKTAEELGQGQPKAICNGFKNPETRILLASLRQVRTRASIANQAPVENK
jgi:hypothetical protein